MFFALFACVTAPTLDDRVDAFLAAEGIDPADCGSVSFDQDRSCDSEAAAAFTCFAAAWEGCTPSRLDLSTPTIEGDPIREVFIVYDNGGCTVEHFVDATEDRHGSGEVSEEVCTNLLAADAASCNLSADDCVSDCDDGSDCG